MSQRTLTIIKPVSTRAGKAGAILAHLEKEGFRLLASRKITLSPAQARAFYAGHRERSSSGPIRSATEGPVWAVARGDDAAAHLRGVMGVTDSKKASPGR